MSGKDAGLILVIMLFLGSAVGIIIWSLTLRYRRRELQHKERLAALEKGAPLPVLTEEERRAPWTPRIYLLRGMIWLFAGIGLTLFLAAAAVTSVRPRTVEDRIWAANRMRSFGATEDQIKRVENETEPHQGMPLGLSLIGLVPIGVGLAYIIFYRAEAASSAGSEPRP